VVTEIKQHGTASDWNWSTRTAVPPTSKSLQTDTGGWDVATVINVTAIDNNNVDRTSGINLLRAGDIVRVEHFQDNTRFATFTVTGPPVDNSGYFAVPVAPLAQGGTIPANNTQLYVTASSWLPPDTAPTPNPGYMSVMLQLQPNITEGMASDLQEYLCDYLFTVTHLVNYVSLSANVGGVIITDEEEITPVSKGDLVPPPAGG